MIGSEFVIPGIVIFVFGAFFVTWSMVVNQYFETTVGIQKDRSQKVISSGPYAFVRHPGYAGMILIYLVPPLIICSGYALIPALAQADVGVAVGSGTDVAIESGEVVLVKSDLRDIAVAIELSRYTMKKIKQNLFWAFVYNAVGIPVAMGVLYPVYNFQLPVSGFLLNPVIAGASMAFSSVSVASNSLLMRGWKPGNMR